MKRTKTILTVAIGLLLISCGEGDKEVENVIRPVKSEEISYSGGFQSKVFNGVSKSGSETKLSFRANGLIVLLEGKIGDKVEKGQLLAKLDQKDIALSYEKAKSTATSARIQMETAKSNLDRVKELYQSNSASLRDYEEAKNNYANATSGYQTAKKSMSLQASQFEYTKIVAPAAGVISKKNHDVNENVQAGEPIFIINSEGGDLEIKVGAPEKYISKIKNGAEVNVLINQEQVQGYISEVGYATDESGTYPITVILVEPSENLRPDMPAEVTFTFGSKETQAKLLVPIKAVGEDENGNFVFLLIKNEDDTYAVKKQGITVGELSDEGFSVESGLEENDRVATAGLRTLHSDMTVSLLK
jgi:membrane fusion protein, multidrug efflux system